MAKTWDWDDVWTERGEEGSWTYFGYVYPLGLDNQGLISGGGFELYWVDLHDVGGASDDDYGLDTAAAAGSIFLQAYLQCGSCAIDDGTWVMYNTHPLVLDGEANWESRPYYENPGPEWNTYSSWQGSITGYSDDEKANFLSLYNPHSITGSGDFKSAHDDAIGEMVETIQKNTLVTANTLNFKKAKAFVTKQENISAFGSEETKQTTLTVSTAITTDTTLPDGGY